MNNKELEQRYKMALESILCLNSYYGIECAQQIAERALQSISDDVVNPLESYINED